MLMSATYHCRPSSIRAHALSDKGCQTAQHSMEGLWVHQAADVLELTHQTSFRLKPKTRIMYLVDIQITASMQTQYLEHSHCAHNVTIYNQNIRGLINKTKELLIVISMEQSPAWEANWFPDRQEITALHGTQSLTTAFTTACHLSLRNAHTYSLTLLGYFATTL